MRVLICVVIAGMHFSFVQCLWAADTPRSLGIKCSEKSVHGRGKFPVWEIDGDCKNCYLSMDEVILFKEPREPAGYYHSTNIGKPGGDSTVFISETQKAKREVVAYDPNIKKIIHFNAKLCKQNQNNCTVVKPQQVLVEDYVNGICMSYPSFEAFTAETKEGLTCEVNLGSATCKFKDKVVIQSNGNSMVKAYTGWTIDRASYNLERMTLLDQVCPEILQSYPSMTLRKIRNLHSISDFERSYSGLGRKVASYGLGIYDVSECFESGSGARSDEHVPEGLHGTK